MKHQTRVIHSLLLSVLFSSCVVDVPTETPKLETTLTETEPKQVEPEPAIIAQEEIMIKPIKEYPAYILDQCGTLWGIPQTFQGEGQKERIVIERDDGQELHGVDFFTVDGVMFITHSYTKYSAEEPNIPISCIDYYRQESGVVSLVDSISDKPALSRVAYDGAEWLIESSVISGVPVSMLYNRNPEIVASNGNYGGRGAWIRTFNEVNGFVVLDKGLLIMTPDGGMFAPCNHANCDVVSEKGRLWK